MNEILIVAISLVTAFVAGIEYERMKLRIYGLLVILFFAFLGIYFSYHGIKL